MPYGNLFGIGAPTVDLGGYGRARNVYQNWLQSDNPYAQMALAQMGGSPGGPSGPNTVPPQVPGQITGAPGYGGSAAAGSKPRVPRLGMSMQQAINQNLNNLPRLQNLAGQVNQFNLGQVTSQFEQGRPGYQAAIAQEARNVDAGLQGLVNEDVRRAIWRDAAGWGAAFGGGGAGATERSLAGSLGLENLGLTSLGEQQRAAQNLRADLAAIPRAGTYDVEGKLITPQQQQAAVFQANVINSLPDPEAAYLRAKADATAGLGTGFGMGRFNAGGGGGGGYQTPSFSLPTQGGIPTTPPPVQPGLPPAATPTGPGYGWTASYIPGQGPTGFGTSGEIPAGYIPAGYGTQLPASSTGMYDYLYA